MSAPIQSSSSKALVQQPTSSSRPAPQLTPPGAHSTPNGTTTANLAQKFTPQRAAPLTPSQRQEQITREAERRRRERHERENKELPVPEPQQPPTTTSTTARAPAAAATGPSRLPVPVRTNGTNGAAANPTAAAAAAASAAVTKAKPREQRISALSETQIMDKLKSVVTHADPNTSYTKIKKVGQGASGSVYVARYTGQIPLRTKAGVNIAGGNKVAIKQMDLANQPRKELIVNEILVMKESQHPNIVNFLDSYLVRGNELWVVMEFMEGGALTDVIDHNTLSEDQISCISLEVSTTANTPAFPFSFHVLS